MKSINKAYQFSTILVVILFLSTTIYAQEKVSFSEATSITKKITVKYFSDYFKLDFDAMKDNMHDDISFHDPTAELIMGTRLVEGRTNVYESFKKNYAAIIEMKQEPIRTIFSSTTGIFEIIIKYRFNDGPDKMITIEMPLVVVLTVKDGKVIEHRDYADYNYFIEQYNTQK